MGIFSTILHIIKNMNNAKKLRASGKENLLKLEDEDFYEAVNCLCQDAVYDIHAKDINHTQIMAYSLFNFEMELNNGGLCQFFVNSSSECAPFMIEAFDLIGANDVKMLFSQFIKDNNIDVCDLSSFKIDDVDEYEAQTERYDFDSFDDKFYECENFHKQIIDYCRENIDEIICD